MGIHDGPEIITLKSVDEIENYRRAWENMQWHPNADIDFYLAINSSRPEIVRPHIILLLRKQTPEAIVVGRIEEGSIECRLGYAKIYKPRLRLLKILYGGLLGNLSADNADIIVSELKDLLKRREAEAVYFHFVGINSEIYKQGRSRGGFFVRDHFPLIQEHWRTEIPLNVNEFIQKMSSKHRYWIRRVQRLLEKDYTGKVIFNIFQNQNDVERLINDAEIVAKATYQWGLGVAFSNNCENRRRLFLSAEKGWLRGYMLHIAGEPAAFWIGTLYKGVFYLGFTGYKPKFRKYELGTILFLRMVENLCESKVKEIDYGFGNAFYKTRFGTTKSSEASIYLFSRTIKGIRINAFRVSIFGISHLLRFFLGKVKMEGRLKKYWREQLRIKGKK